MDNDRDRVSEAERLSSPMQTSPPTMPELQDPRERAGLHSVQRIVSRRQSVLIFQLDGKIPNIACMRIAEHHKQRGDEVKFRWTGSPERELWDKPDVVYASAIFEKSRPVVDKLRENFPAAITGGTGVDVASNLESHGITTTRQDYSLYPNWRQSIGFTQRGCRLKCSFCVVPRKEGAIREEQTVWELWRGDPWPRELILLDNDFFGQPNWRKRIEEMRSGKFKVSFNQGINARFLTDEAAEAAASVDYRDDSMKSKRIYTAWDNRKDEERLMAGLNRLVKYGVKPDHITVYILIGYWQNETEEDRLYRWKRLVDFGARPFPMPFVRTPELVGFQRWIVGSYARRGITWQAFVEAKYRPEKLGLQNIEPFQDFQATELEMMELSGRELDNEASRDAALNPISAKIGNLENQCA